MPVSGPTLRESQLAMARHLRDPARVPGPDGVEPRRLKVYQDLIYRNIEGFIAGGFPVLKSLYRGADWHALVRAFIDGHPCRSPYFLEIGQEFLHFLLEQHQRRACDPPFMTELAHYEWVELALDVSEETLPPEAPLVAPLPEAVLTLSPLAWSLAYPYPVHRIGPGFRPEAPGETTYLVVYRDRVETVRFMELNAATARLLALFRDNRAERVAALLGRLAAELGLEEGSVQAFGADQVEQFLAQAVLVPAQG
jgi:hypothetical protein